LLQTQRHDGFCASTVRPRPQVGQKELPSMMTGVHATAPNHDLLEAQALLQLPCIGHCDTAHFTWLPFKTQSCLFKWHCCVALL